MTGPVWLALVDRLLRHMISRESESTHQLHLDGVPELPQISLHETGHQAG